MKNKICLILNTAPHYRKGIFFKIDQSYDCVWASGHIKNIKDIDWSTFAGEIVNLKNINLFSNFYWQKGAVTQILRKDISHFVMIGEVYNVSSWLVAAIAKFRGKKLVFWSHGVYGKEGIFKRLIYRIYWKLPAAGFIYNNRSRSLLTEECGVKRDKLVTIYNSLDYDTQLQLRNNCMASDIYSKHFNNNCPNLIFIGRLTAVKRLDLMIDAMKILFYRGFKCNFTLVGDGPVNDSLTKKVAEYNLNGHVWFFGACYNEKQNSNLIYNADLCVAPGNIGLTAMHSLMFGCPAATHNNFPMQMPEFEAIEDGKSGFFFDYLNAHSIAESIEKWFSRKDYKRNEIRNYCYSIIDTLWNPNNQIKIINNVMKDDKT